MAKNCPDCKRKLRGDGSCCDYCDWAMVGGGPRLPSNRSAEEIRLAIVSRHKRACTTENCVLDGGDEHLDAFKRTGL